MPFRIVEKYGEGTANVVLAENLLHAFNMVLNQPRDEVRLRVRESTLGEDMVPTELRWAVRDGKVVAVGMLEDGVAKKAGIELGDELVRVGDADIHADDPRSVCAARLWGSKSGDPVSMRVRRNGAEFEVTVPNTEGADSTEPSGSGSP